MVWSSRMEERSDIAQGDWRTRRSNIKVWLRMYWKYVFVLLTPIFLSPMAVTGKSQELRCAFVILVMATYWVTEALPLCVTALIPVFLFPLLGILSTKAVCEVYLKDTTIKFLGGLMMAVAVEHCNLHKRIALITILWIGQSSSRLLAGFMIPTAVLSMWISNTATAAMMVPIVEALSQELKKTMILKKRRSMKAASACENNVGLAEHTTNAALEADITPDNSSFVISIEEEYTAYRKMLYLGVAFAANIGGTGSPLGCGPNFVIFGILQSTFAESTGLNFATWMLLNVPGMILCLSLGWCWLMLHFKQYRSCKKRGSDNMGDEEQEESIRDFLLDHYKALGPLSQHEIRVGVSFSILVLLWIFRSPGFITGWAFYISSSFEDNLLIRDATPVIFMVFLLFIIPAGSSTANNNQYNPGLNREECKRRENAFEACLTWEVVQARVPWGVVLLLGGGLALAEGSKVSGLSSWLGHQLTKVAIMPKEAIVFTITILSAMVTEVASNTATASVILPVILDLALAIQVNPLYLMLPATVCCAYAFMLPVATPGNAIILTASGLSTYEMVKAGFMMNILCVLVINFTINTLGNAIFDLHTMPTWAINATVTGNGT